MSKLDQIADAATVLSLRGRDLERRADALMGQTYPDASGTIKQMVGDAWNIEQLRQKDSELKNQLVAIKEGMKIAMKGIQSSKKTGNEIELRKNDDLYLSLSMKKSECEQAINQFKNQLKSSKVSLW